MSVGLYLACAASFLLAAQGIFRFLRHQYSRRGHLAPGAALLQVLVFAMHAGLLGIALRGSNWTRWPESLVQLTLASVVGGAGLALLLAAFISFGSPAKVIGYEVSELAISGVYLWSRNPQLLGYGLFLLAFLILWPSWQVALAWTCLPLISHWMVRVEEEHLHRVHGEAFRNYCVHTARYFRLPGGS